MWIFRLTGLANVFVHWEHLYGFSSKKNTGMMDTLKRSSNDEERERETEA
jgi:hypothetical protein